MKNKNINIIKIIFGVVALIIVVVVLIMLFSKKGFSSLTNKELICENVSPGYKTKSVIIYNANNTYKEQFGKYEKEKNEPLTSEYTFKKATKEDLKKKEYKYDQEVHNGDSYLLTLKERKQKQPNGKVITLDKNVEYVVTIKNKNVQIYSKSRNINKLCKIK